MQINNYNYNKPQSKLSFGKVIKVNVFIDGLQTTDKGRIQKAVRGFTKILQKVDTKHPSADTFIATFKNNVPDYNVPASKVDSGYPIIRNLIDWTNRFLFTGDEVQHLNKLAPKIGVAKGNGLQSANTTRTYEAKLETDNYFRTAKSFIKDRARRLTKGSLPREEMELNIYTKAKGNPKSKNFKLLIDDIKFEKSASKA